MKIEKQWLSSYDRGVPEKITLPDSHLYGMFLKSCQNSKNANALNFLGRNISYAQLLKDVDRCASGLRSMGLKKGDAIALLLPNCPQFVISWLAAQKLGIIAAAFNPLYTERELTEVLKNSKARVIITLTKFAPLVNNIRKDVGISKIIITSIGEFLPLPIHKKILFYIFISKIDGSLLSKLRYYMARFFGSRFSQFSDLISKRKYNALSLDSDIDLDDIAAFQYTGGTTGVSKAAMLSHRNLISQCFQLRSWMVSFKEGEEILMGVLPFFHVYGLMTGLILGLLTESKIILLPKFNAKEVLKSIHDYRVTVFNGVPAMFKKINEVGESYKVDLGSLKFCISGADRLEKEVKEEFENLTKAVLVEGYGLSETSPVTHINPFNGEQKIGSIGIPIPSTEVKIFDINTPGKELEVNERGQLAVRGPQVMAGYWNNDKETKNIFYEDYLLTGDIVQMDSDGYFFLVDRLKEMINSGGLKIYPSEVESVLISHESVKDAMAVGMPNKTLGEVVRAYVVVKNKISQKELIDFCKKNLAVYKVPRKIEFREELPRSIIGKALKKNL